MAGTRCSGCPSPRSRSPSRRWRPAPRPAAAPWRSEMAGASGPAAGAPVAIIGGGLAGLHAARLLRSEGVAFRLLEARDRLGGRILSADTAGRVSADGFDLGPSWFWPDLHPAMAAIVAELGLEAFP